MFGSGLLLFLGALVSIVASLHCIWPLRKTGPF
jgi:hypothetical protein